MWSRVAVSAGCLASLPVFIPKAYAADGKMELNKKCLPSQLPLYDLSEPVPYSPPADPETFIRRHVSTVRKFFWQYLKSVETTTDTAKNKLAEAEERGRDAITFVQEDSGVLPRAGIITVAGLGGIVAGYKGGAFRKGFLATSAMLAAAAVCYPHQAVDVTRAGWNRFQKESTGFWQLSNPEFMTKTKSPEPVAESKESDVQVEDKDKKQILPKSKAGKGGKPEVDHGMSKEEDKDMYTTRTS